MSTEYATWVSKLQAIGFNKVCVIDASYQTKSSSGGAAVASAWNDSEGKLVNENQELANDWAKAEKFTFYKTKFQVYQKSAKHLVGQEIGGKKVIVAQHVQGCWVVAEGKLKGMDLSKKAKKGKKDAKTFPNPPTAYNNACTALFDELLEDEE